MEAVRDESQMWRWFCLSRRGAHAVPASIRQFMDDLLTTIVHILPIHGTSVVGFQLNCNFNAVHGEMQTS